MISDYQLHALCHNLLIHHILVVGEFFSCVLLDVKFDATFPLRFAPYIFQIEIFVRGEFSIIFANEFSGS